jgi:hypothetical protein
MNELGLRAPGNRPQELLSTSRCFHVDPSATMQDFMQLFGPIKASPSVPTLQLSSTIPVPNGFVDNSATIEGTREFIRAVKVSVILSYSI